MMCKLACNVGSRCSPSFESPCFLASFRLTRGTAVPRSHPGATRVDCAPPSVKRQRSRSDCEDLRAACPTPSYIHPTGQAVVSIDRRTVHGPRTPKPHAAQQSPRPSTSNQSRTKPTWPRLPSLWTRLAGVSLRRAPPLVGVCIAIDLTIHVGNPRTARVASSMVLVAVAIRATTSCGCTGFDRERRSHNLTLTASDAHADDQPNPRNESGGGECRLAYNAYSG